jgi:hypothetical protein
MEASGCPQHESVLIGVIENPETSLAMLTRALQTLLRIGSTESTSFVLDHVLATYNDAEEERRAALLSCFDTPMGTDAALVLLELLLGRASYEAYRHDLPKEIRNALRKALRAAPDREAIGRLAAELYTDPGVISRPDALWELFDELAHPHMLANLAIQAAEEGLTDNATAFLLRLAETDEESTVSAFMEAAASDALSVDEVGGVLYQWTTQNRGQAKPGHFLGYITGEGFCARQRAVAAHGMAGCEDAERVELALRKALSHERDVLVRANLEAALTLLTQGDSE